MLEGPYHTPNWLIMREPPPLTEATIRATLHTHYGLAVAALTFLPIGNDSDSSAYCVTATDGLTYFLKVRAGRGFNRSSLVIPHYLHNQGVPHLVAPRLTLAQHLWVTVSDFALSLYPFINAQTAAEAGLSEQHWRAWGATMHQIHAQPIPADLQPLVRRETFIPSRRQVLMDLEATINRQVFANPAERELAAFWQMRPAEIHRVIGRADALGHHVRQTSLPLVVCHADLHTWNVLLDTTQQFWLVDWDEVTFAPKERDLMFVMEGIGRDLVSASETASFLQGYGDDAINSDALVYYRYAWAAQDMGAYGEQVFFSPEVSVETRHEAVQGFMSLFEPGNIVSIAFASDNLKA